MSYSDKRDIYNIDYIKKANTMFKDSILMKSIKFSSIFKDLKCRQPIDCEYNWWVYKKYTEVRLIR